MEKVGSVIVSPWKVQAVTVPDQKSGRLTRCSQRSTALQHDQSSAKHASAKNPSFSLHYSGMRLAQIEHHRTIPCQRKRNSNYPTPMIVKRFYLSAAT
ncbi:hypothetical protein [Caballeronia sordidicola]|uniref:hypothetical protein n=1 Tax=Caballeronia sordidicola TaxID=196367 RepID=UPI00190FA479|nr:hypothetical protein [Caballeronia sordidicola]